MRILKQIEHKKLKQIRSKQNSPSPKLPTGTIFNYFVYSYIITPYSLFQSYVCFDPAYNASQTGKNYVNCDFEKPPGEGQVCATDLSKMGNCNHGRAYGYNSSSPCIFLKLNRVRHDRKSLAQWRSLLYLAIVFCFCFVDHRMGTRVLYNAAAWYAGWVENSHSKCKFFTKISS